MDVAKAVKEVKQGKIDFKVDKSGIVHTSIGKVSFLSLIHILGNLLRRDKINHIVLSNQQVTHYNRISMYITSSQIKSP